MFKYLPFFWFLFGVVCVCLGVCVPCSYQVIFLFAGVCFCCVCFVELYLLLLCLLLLLLLVELLSNFAVESLPSLKEQSLPETGLRGPPG